MSMAMTNIYTGMTMICGNGHSASWTVCVLLTATRTPIRMKSRKRTRERIFMRHGACHTPPPRREADDSVQALLLVVVGGFRRQEAGRTRLRPVLMTAITTIVALLPMALTRGQGSEVWNPLGATILGGLLVSTLVTLVLVPVIYSIFESRAKLRNSG